MLILLSSETMDILSNADVCCKFEHIIVWLSGVTFCSLPRDASGNYISSAHVNMKRRVTFSTFRSAYLWQKGVLGNCVRGYISDCVHVCFGKAGHSMACM